MKRALTALAIFLVLAGLSVAAFGWHLFHRPGPLPEATTVLIPDGADPFVISRKLHENGILRHPVLFRPGVRTSGNATRLKAGEYAIPAYVSPAGAMDILTGGKTISHKLTVPEGWTVHQVTKMLMDMPLLSGEIDSRPAEGSLLPETYHFKRGTPRSALIDRMQKAMELTLETLWSERNVGNILPDKHAAVTLASIVEHETAVYGERSHIAGIFLNRLNKGMRLQSDPTVIYALSDGRRKLDRLLTRRDLKQDHPYNTYRRGGLPPGPICNPGRAALEAVLNPAKTDSLYFVANGEGGHMFSRTLKEHNRNVQKWRHIKNAP